MGNKEKKQKRKDKKRRQRTREKKGVLPSSVQALLGYLGGGGPGPATQGDTKPRERAGVDSFDTLHQIIKSQQMMSAGYMANLEKLAYKTELSEQLKKQGEENKRQIDDTLKQTTQTSKVSQKIQKVGNQILWNMSLKNPTPQQQENLLVLQKKLEKYQGQYQFADKISSYQNPTLPNNTLTIPVATSLAPATARNEKPKAGGGSTNIQLFVQPAEGSSVLSSVDPASYSQLLAGPAHSPQKTYTTSDELKHGSSNFHFVDATSTSLTTMADVSKAIYKQEQLIRKSERKTVASSKAITEMLSPKPKKK